MSSSTPITPKTPAAAAERFRCAPYACTMAGAHCARNWLLTNTNNSNQDHYRMRRSACVGCDQGQARAKLLDATLCARDKLRIKEGVGGHLHRTGGYTPPAKPQAPPAVVTPQIINEPATTQTRKPETTMTRRSPRSDAAELRRLHAALGRRLSLAHILIAVLPLKGSVPRALAQEWLLKGAEAIDRSTTSGSVAATVGKAIRGGLLSSKRGAPVKMTAAGRELAEALANDPPRAKAEPAVTTAPDVKATRATAEEALAPAATAPAPEAPAPELPRAASPEAATPSPPLPAAIVEPALTDESPSPILEGAAPPALADVLMQIIANELGQETADRLHAEAHRVHGVIQAMGLWRAA